MKKLALLLLSLLLLLSGCAGNPFFAEYRLTKEGTANLARHNAAMNLGVLHECLTVAEVSEPLYYIGRLIEISSGFDKYYYEEVYNDTFHTLDMTNCEEESKFLRESGQLVAMTQSFARGYHQAAQSLANARQQDAMYLAMFSQNMNALANSTDPMKYSNISIPGVNFAPQTPALALPSNLLVNTSGGLRQCRVSTSGAVFCF